MSEHGEKLAGKTPEQAAEFAKLKGAERPIEAQDHNPERQSELLHEARQEIQELAAPKEHLALPVDEKPQDNQPFYIDKVVKKLKLKQNLGQIRGQLSPTTRALSKVVHQPVVRALSEASARTVTRPSGLLGAGLCAFLGSLGYLYYAKHIGFSYNYLLFFAFFAGGFVVGLGLEFVLWFVHPKHQE